MRQNLIKKITSSMMAIMIVPAVICNNSISTVAEDSSQNLQVGEVGYCYEYFTNLGIDFTSLRADLVSALSQHLDSVNIYKYAIPYTQANVDALNTLLYKDICENFDCTTFSLSISTGSKLHTLYFTHNLSDEEYFEKLAELENGAENLLSGIKNNPDLTVVQKALLVHDRLIVQTAYEYYHPVYAFEAYGPIVDGKGVCEGYAKAYQYLLNMLNIPNYYCRSATLYHGWNIVYINNTPYNVDVTWDDPQYDKNGRVMHNYFLLSNNALKQTREDGKSSSDTKNYLAINDYENELTEIPSDTTYDNYYWKNSRAEFLLISGEIYYYDNQDGALMTESGDVIYNSTFVWRTRDNYIWSLNGTTIASFCGEILLSQTDKVLVIDPNRNSVRTAYEPANMQSFYAIYGITCKDGALKYSVYESPTNSTPIMEDTVVLGDANGDGEMNTGDLIHIKRLISSNNSTFVAGLGNAGSATDLSLFRQMLLN